MQFERPGRDMEMAAKAHDAGMDEKEQQALIQCFEKLAALDSVPKITLTNIYKEIPISYPATICDIKSDHIELCTNELQLAAISQCHEVYIRAPHLEGPVIGRLHSIDLRRSVVRLCKFSYAALEEDKRVTLRVRFRRPISIMMHVGAEKISGVIHDISLGGCCLNTFVRMNFERPRTVEIELKLIDQKSGEVCIMRIPSSIIRIEGDAPLFRCALRFEHSPQSESFLSTFINQRQLEILKELRESL
jgi:hypothetical protein